ncbi:MAG: HIT domain-containing protein [Bdellovibrionales bacterium]|nr:HIT domain-containing protein [Bdellovibrionales bacterium]
MKNTGWPKDRGQLFNPERKAYHSGKKLKSCVFCEAKAKKPSFDNLVLYRNSTFMIILNKYPYHIGHMMVMPTKHKGDLWSLTKKEYMLVQLAIRECLAALESEYQCQGLNMGINLGRAAGAGIPDHIHYHLIPRWVGDCNFFPQIAKTRVFTETLEQTYYRLQPRIEKAMRKVK